MNKRTALFALMIILISLLISCGGPAATAVPAATQAPIIEAPDVTEALTATVTSFDSLAVILVVDNFNSIEENTSDDGVCPLSADGQGLPRARGSSMTILGKPHGLFVYGDLIHEIQKQQSGDGFGSRLLTEGQGFDGVSSL